MADEKELSDVIQQTAAGPAAVTIDGNSATAQDLLKQIEADKYLASRAAVRQVHRGLRFTKMAAPGA